MKIKTSNMANHTISSGTAVSACAVVGNRTAGGCAHAQEGIGQDTAAMIWFESNEGFANGYVDILFTREELFQFQDMVNGLVESLPPVAEKGAPVVFKLRK